jgi:hypothetical protein
MFKKNIIKIVLFTTVLFFSCKPNDQLSDDEVLGHYFTVHAAVVNINLNKDYTFVFNSADKNGNSLLKKGTYQILNDSILNLKNNDHSTDIFYIKNDKEHKQYQIYNKDCTHFMIKPY